MDLIEHFFKVVSNETEMKNLCGYKTGKEIKDKLIVTIKNNTLNKWEAGKSHFECVIEKSNIFFEPITIDKEVQPNQTIEINLLFPRSADNIKTGDVVTILQFLYNKEKYNQETILFKKSFNVEGIDIEEPLKKGDKEISLKKREIEKVKIEDGKKQTNENGKKINERKNKEEEEKRKLTKEEEMIQKRKEERKRIIEESKRKGEEKEKKKKEEEQIKKQKEEEAKIAAKLKRKENIEKIKEQKKKEKEEKEKKAQIEEEEIKQKIKSRRNKIIEETKKKIKEEIEEENKKNEEEKIKKQKEEEEKLIAKKEMIKANKRLKEQKNKEKEEEEKRKQIEEEEMQKKNIRRRNTIIEESKILREQRRIEQELLEKEKNDLIEEERRKRLEERNRIIEENKIKVEKERKRKEEEEKKKNEEERNKILEQRNRINNNIKLKRLNDKLLKNLFGEKQKQLSEERKMQIFDRKIKNYEIKEKIKYKIKIKNPKEKIRYESIIYDEDGNIIKTSEKKEGTNEIVLFDDVEMNYTFTKVTSITMELIKYIDNNEIIRTKKVIPLKKIFHPQQKEYEEKIDDSTGDEILNIDYDEPEKKEDEKYIQLSFNINNDNRVNNYINSNISYSIQKNDEIIFKSALCDNLNIKKTDKIPESLLKPEFEISFYNDDFEEKKIKINYNDLFQGVEIKEFPDFQINILPQFVKKNRLIKLIKNGLNLDLSIAIDFTGSNGCPEYPTCLHYINHGFINNYEKAIRENYKIISTLNEKDKYDIYGFGAEINGIFEKCFNLNMTDNPSIIGIENIISEYKKAVKNVYFSGGTFFAPIINRINDVMKNMIYSNFNYHILLIISDGLIHDLQRTIDSIVESSKYPLSIIIIGVGELVNDDMKTLNGEKGKLISSNGEILNKDIVQYVHFKDYADDANKLIEAVLKYIPDQITDFYGDKIKE